MLHKISFSSILILLSFGLFLLAGCGDDNKVNSSGEVFSKNQFPISVGSQWEYQVTDPRAACPLCADTIVVSVIDSTTKSSNIINEIWHILKNDSNMTLSQRILQDSIKLNWDNQLSFNIKVPLEVGEIWKDHPNVTLYKDSTIVTGYGSITTPAGTFDNAFVIEGVKQAFESNTTFKVWLVPDVGIVRIEYSVENPNLNINVASHWALISYSQTGTFDHFTVDQFPNFNGLSWNYNYTSIDFYIGSVVDSTVDNILVNLAESSTVAVWTYAYTDSTIIEYVEINTDTVFVYSDNMLSQVKSKFIFPFSIDQNWIVNDRISEISNLYNFIYDGDSYFPTYVISTEIDCGVDCTIKEQCYYTPNIGLIYKQISEFSSDTEINISTLTNLQIWSMTSYSIPMIP